MLPFYCIACADTSNESHTTHQQENQSAGMMSNVADYADSVNKGLIPEDTLKGSPRRITDANIGEAHVHIEYGSPGVKGRTIWGALVPYDAVWVTGAHAATTINFSKDVRLIGKPVKAGTYALFTIPGKERWVIILNSRYSQHLTDDYNPQEDVIRIVVPFFRIKKNVERLTFIVAPESETSGQIVMKWENIAIILPVKSDEI